MQKFWNHFLPSYKRYPLIPYQMQQMWRSMQPTPESTWPIGLRNILYQLHHTPYGMTEWYPLLNGQFPQGYGYRHFTVAKKDGTPRHLSEPYPKLKAMQHKILENFLNREKPDSAAVGYRKKMSVADHLWPHAGAKCIITADIQDFFPSTSRYRVRQYWKHHPKVRTDDEVQLLTNLTTYRGSLPQGAPTSPALSNLVNRELDVRLRKLAEQHGGRYTRYADDMVFSWRGRSRPPSDFEGTARRILREYGYRLHPKKGWQVWQRADEPEITGGRLTRSGSVDVTRDTAALMRKLARSNDPADGLRLLGYEGYRKMLRYR